MQSIGKAIGTSIGKEIGWPYADAPLNIPGLKAWFDARSDEYFTFSTGAQISAWVSRAGSLGNIAWGQSTSANQAVRAQGVSVLNGTNTVQFDGVNDFMESTSQDAWKSLHDGTGSEVFFILSVDTTGQTIQNLLIDALGSIDVGIMLRVRDSTGANGQRICNGSGTNYTNAFNFTGSADTEWRSVAYTEGTITVSYTGTSLTHADTVGQPPSSASPTRTVTLGWTPGGGQVFKGHLAQLLFFDHVLTTAERASLAAWANREFGVAA
jgi:hypothetical protein